MKNVQVFSNLANKKKTFGRWTIGLKFEKSWTFFVENLNKVEKIENDNTIHRREFSTLRQEFLQKPSSFFKI